MATMGDLQGEIHIDNGHGRRTPPFAAEGRRHSEPNLKRRRITKACDFCHRRGRKCKPATTTGPTANSTTTTSTGEEQQQSGVTPAAAAAGAGAGPDGPPPSCLTCIEHGAKCTWNRIAAKRGVKSKTSPASGRPSQSLQYADADGSDRWFYDESRHGSRALVHWLICIFFDTVYPVFPFYDENTIMREWAESSMSSDRPAFARLMAICALSASHVRDGALFNLNPDDIWHDQYHEDDDSDRDHDHDHDRYRHHIKMMTVRDEYQQAYLDDGRRAIPDDTHDLMTSGSRSGDDVFQYLQVLGTMALAAIQIKDDGLFEQYLGRYHSIVAHAQFQFERHWGPNLTSTDVYVRRQFFWSMYRLEVHSALIQGHVIRCPELQCGVGYPVHVGGLSGVLDPCCAEMPASSSTAGTMSSSSPCSSSFSSGDVYVQHGGGGGGYGSSKNSSISISNSNSSAGNNMNNSSSISTSTRTSTSTSNSNSVFFFPGSWLVGWNYITDLYRILEHVVVRMRKARVQAAHTDRNNSNIDRLLPPIDEMLREVLGRKKRLPPYASRALPASKNREENLCGFQVANIACTYQLTRMAAFACENQFEEACEAAIDLIEEITQVPPEYLRAIGHPMLQELVGVGHILSSFIGRHLHTHQYFKLRNVMRVMATFLQDLGSCLPNAPQISGKLFTYITKIDEEMYRQSQQQLSAAAALELTLPDLSTMTCAQQQQQQQQRQQEQQLEQKQQQSEMLQHQQQVLPTAAAAAAAATMDQYQLMQNMPLMNFTAPMDFMSNIFTTAFNDGPEIDWQYPFVMNNNHQNQWTTG